MKTSKYLYNIDMIDLKDQPYEKVLLHKIKAGNVLLEILVRKHNMEDNMRMIAVNKAINFNRDLLAELGYQPADISSMVRSYDG